MTTIKGDLLDITEGIICHQVNCQHVAGAGLALQIRSKWYDWFCNFKAHQAYLGKCWIWRVRDYNLYIVSLYAQDRIGRNGLQTNYVAFENTLISLKDKLEQSSLKDFKLYFPFGIGCGLAGGDWSIIESMIERYFPEAILVKKV